MRSQAYVTGVFMLVIATLAITGCGGTPRTTKPQPTLPPYKQAITYVKLANTAPSNIDFALTVSVEKPLPPDKPAFTLQPVFYAANTSYKYSQVVSFTSGEKFVCNGVPMPTNSSNPYVTAEIPAPGTVFNCIYSSPQGSAEFSFTSPVLPDIVSPVANAKVERSKQTPVVITPTSACHYIGFSVLSAARPGEVSGGTVGGSPNCATHQSVDTSSATSGSGVLGIDEGDFNGTLADSAGFHSLAMMVKSEVNIPVTWV